MIGGPPIQNMQMFPPGSLMIPGPVGPRSFPSQPAPSPIPFPVQTSMGQAPSGGWMPAPNNVRPRPIIRLQMADTPPVPPAPPPVQRPLALSMPSPEALGVSPGAPAMTAREEAPVDWNHTEDRLRRLGAVAFNRARVHEGGYRVTLLLPTGEQNLSHCVEAAAQTEAVAVRLALQRAEEWAALRR